MTKHAVEQRYFEVRDIDAPANLSTLTLMAVPYDEWTNLGYYHERIAKGAPDKSIKEAAKALPLLLFHDNMKHAVGKAAHWTISDPAGLIGRFDIDLEDERAVEGIRKVRDGFLSGASIGFMPIRSTRVFVGEDEWDKRVEPEDEWDMQVTRDEIRLVEVSLTPTPAYASATVIDARQLTRSSEPRSPRFTGMAAQTKRTIADLRALR